MCFRRRYGCDTSWLSTWGTNLTMNLVMWTISRLQTPGATFNENDQPPVFWAAASFRFRLELCLITGGRSVVGTSFYLVPSFTAFLSSFNHLHVLVFCSHCFFFQPSVWCKLSETLFQSSDLWGKSNLSLLKTECVCTHTHINLHTVQQSSQMSHVMWIAYNMSYIISVVHQPLMLNPMQMCDSFQIVGWVSENVPRSVCATSVQRLQVHSNNNASQFNFKSVKCLKGYFKCVYSLTNSQNTPCIQMMMQSSWYCYLLGNQIFRI